jgi:Tol biopolymer transport system component
MRITCHYKAKALPSKWILFAVAVSLFFVARGVGSAASIQPVSVLDQPGEVPGSGAGDSGISVLSPDGRYVLFASTANNLTSIGSSNAAPLPIYPSLNVFLRDRTAGLTELESINSSGSGGGNNDSLPRGISTNGQYVLFESSATNLVANDTNSATDIFVRDRNSGSTVLVSVSMSGTVGNGNSRDPVMTPDGRYVAFVSEASNLVPGDTNGIPDVFVRDLVANTTTLVSAGAISTGSALLRSGSESPDITPDGHFVVFYSSSTNVVPGGTKAGEVYVRDLVGGTTIWASTNAQTIIGTTNEVSFNAAISADGQFVAFETCTNPVTGLNPSGIILRYGLQSGTTDIIHTNAYVSFPGFFPDIHNLDMTPDGSFIAFVANTNNSGNTIVYLWNSQWGTNLAVSQNINNLISTNGFCDQPRISSDGQFVAFLSSATDLTTNTGASGFHLYVRDIQGGTSQLVDVGADGNGAGVEVTTVPLLSADGKIVAFESLQKNLAPGDLNRDYDLFVRNLVAQSNELISVRQLLLPSETPNGLNHLYASCISTNGRYVAFSSDADNLYPAATNGFRNIFVRDMFNGNNILVSAGGNGISDNPSISGDGRYVAFASYATNLVNGDTNNSQDVILRDLANNTNILVSASTTGGFGNDNSSSPTVSTDGKYVLFTSLAGNLASGSVGGAQNLYLRNMQLTTNYALTASSSGGFGSMTPDGRFVVFVVPGSPDMLYVWDSENAKRIYTNMNSSIRSLSISPNGHRVAYSAGFGPINLNVVDITSNSTALVSTVDSVSQTRPAFSADGRLLVYATLNANVASDLNGKQDVYLYDFQTHSNVLVSRSFNSSNSPSGVSDSPAISLDGRFVAYRSSATNSASSDFNSASDLFVFDSSNSTTVLISSNYYNSSTANSGSSAPFFSGDGRTLVFRSRASDLVAQDFNYFDDVFAVNVVPFVDSDGDGMDDGWELSYFGTLARDGSGDFDGDGVSDLDEFLAGTDPTDATSFFNVQIASAKGTGIVISWRSSLAKSYKVQFKNDLSDVGWQDLGGTVTVLGNTSFVTDPSPAATQRFYQVVASN